MDFSRSDIVQEIQLPAEVAKRIEEEVGKLEGSPYENADSYIPLLHRAFVAQLPVDVLLQIRTFKEDPKAPGALLFRGLPVDHPLPATPLDGGRSKEKKTFTSEAALLGASLLFGEVYGLKQVKQGELVQTVAPVESKFASQSNEGYGSELKMHTEMSFHPTFRPHYFMLLCLREDKHKEALTFVSDNREVASHLTKEEVELLRDPRFTVHGPETFRAFWTPVQKPIINGPADRPEIVLGLHSEVDSPTAECKAALGRLKEVIEKNVHGVHLEPGDCLIVDNRKVMHGRGVFRADFDGQDRWLQRVHIRETGGLWKTHASVQFPQRVFDGFIV